MAVDVEPSLPQGTLICPQATPLGRGGSSEQMVSPGCQVCSTPYAVWGTGLFGSCRTRPSHARERPQRSVRLGAVCTSGKPEVKGWARRTRVPGGALRPASCPWAARFTPPLTPITWHPKRSLLVLCSEAHAFALAPPLFDTAWLLWTTLQRQALHPRPPGSQPPRPLPSSLTFRELYFMRFFP